MSMSMLAKHFRFFTQRVQRETSKSNAAVTVAAVVHTGTACSDGKSFNFLHWTTILDAGKMKSSTNS